MRQHLVGALGNRSGARFQVDKNSTALAGGIPGVLLERHLGIRERLERSQFLQEVMRSTHSEHIFGPRHSE